MIIATVGSQPKPDAAAKRVAEPHLSPFSRHTRRSSAKPLVTVDQQYVLSSLLLMRSLVIGPTEDLCVEGLAGKLSLTIPRILERENSVRAGTYHYLNKHTT